MVKSEYSLIEPRSELHLAESLSPAYGIHAVPPLVHERCEIVDAPLRAFVVTFEKSGSAAGAELALTCSHSEPCAPAKIYEVVDMQFVNGVIYLGHAHLFALAHQSVIGVGFRFDMS